MNPIRISAKTFVEDIKSGMGDAALMEKYGLSARSLPRVKDELMQRGLLTPGDLRNTNGCPISEKTPIKAKEFVRAFRESPNDFVMMNTYALTSRQLEQIYRQLIAKGLLSEYEFHNRWGKSPDLQEMELPETDDTTVVDFTEEFSGRLKDYHKIDASCPSPERLNRSTSVNDKLHRGPERERAALPPLNGSGLGPCPRCGWRKVRESPDSCTHCGVVFAKVKTDSRRGGVCIWD